MSGQNLRKWMVRDFKDIKSVFKTTFSSAVILAMAFGVLTTWAPTDSAWAKGREKFITREAKSAKSAKGDKTKVNFDEVDIGGQRKTPLGSLVNNNRLDKNYNFIKLRPSWHPEMIESASSLESGGR